METKPSLPHIVAHRGGAKHKGLENTLEAFSRAFTLGVDAIEGDFHLTSDYHIVCHHDYHIKNLTIKNHTLSELKDVQSNLPTLEEVFALIPKDKMMYIEIKCGIEIFEYLAPIIESSNLSHSQIVIISFHAEVIHQVKVTYPNIKAYWLYTFDDEKVTFLELKKVLDMTRADGISTNITETLDKKLIQNFMDAGYSYHVWTYKTYKIDSFEKVEKLKEWGVASITLDAIDILHS